MIGYFAEKMYYAATTRPYTPCAECFVARIGWASSEVYQIMLDTSGHSHESGD